MTRPLHYLNVLLLEQLLCYFSHMLWVFVMLEHQSTTHLQCPGWGKEVFSHGFPGETVPGGNTPRGTNYMATCLPSRKLSKSDEPDMQDKLISDVLLWTPTCGRANAGQLAQTYIQQLCEDTGCSPEDIMEAMKNRENGWERVRDICASGMTWWWWWWN